MADEQLVKDVMTILDYGEESVPVAIEEVRPQEWMQKVYNPEILPNFEKLYKRPGYEPFLNRAAVSRR